MSSKERWRGEGTPQPPISQKQVRRLGLFTTYDTHLSFSLFKQPLFLFFTKPLIKRMAVL